MPEPPLSRYNGSAHQANPSSASTKGPPNGPVLDAEGIAAPDQKLAKRRFQRAFPRAKFHGHCDCGKDHALHCDLDLQLNHFDCWPEDRQILLEKVYKKVTYELQSGAPGFWNNQREWKNYDWTASVIALSTYEGREKFCNCGFHGYSCDDRHFCPRCCYNNLAEPAQREFGRAFTKDNECYYVVTSLSRERDETKRLIFKDLTKSEMEQIKISGRLEQRDVPDYGIKFIEPHHALACQHYWRAFQEVMHEFTGRGKLFSGAFGGPELSVRFLPLRVLPHANYVVWSPGLCSDDLRRLRRAVREKLRGSRRIAPGLYPKLAVYRIQTRADLLAVTRYVFKPIHVGLAYHMAAESSGYAPEALAKLNWQADCFLETVGLAFYGVHRITRMGFCSSISANYVGVVISERQDRREKDAERRKRKKQEENEIRKVFPAYQPHRRKLTQEDRDELLMMRSWHRQLVRDGELPGKPPRRWLRKGPQKTRRARARPG